MPGTHAPPPPFGQIVALARRALGDALDELLRDAGVSFERWAALNMLAARDRRPVRRWLASLPMRCEPTGARPVSCSAGSKPTGWSGRRAIREPSPAGSS